MTFAGTSVNEEIYARGEIFTNYANYIISP